MSKESLNERMLLTGDYPALETAFVGQVKTFREHESFDPLLIFVSSKLLGLHLRRLLADQGVSHFNLRFWTLEEFAREVSTPRLLSQGKKEIPSHADELLIGNISKSLAEKDEEYYFREISGRPGFHRAVLSTLKDLKDACLRVEDIERILRDVKIVKQVHLQKLRDVLKLWKGYEDRLESLKWFDESDVMDSAHQWLKESAIFQQAPKVLAYGYYDFNAVQKRLFQACFEAKGGVVFVPDEPTRSFEYVKPTLKWLRESGFKEISAGTPGPTARKPSLSHLCLHLFNGGKPIETPSDAIQIISAPGEPREVREVIRAALQASRDRGIPFYEIGILLRNPENYVRLFREGFDALGIQPYLREGMPLSETPSGRSLLLLLEICRLNFSRQSVMEFATFAALRSAPFSSSPSQWDAISIRAGIVEDQKEWEERLIRLRESWLRKLDEEEGDEGKKRFSKEDIDALDELTGFTHELFKFIQRLAAPNTWSGKVARLLDAFDGLVEQTDQDLLVKQAVRRLSELDATGIAPSEADFARLVKEVLQEDVIPAGRFQRDGPTVANVMAVRGVPFKMVILPGMVEKSFPPLIRQDAILLDHERKILNRSLGGEETEPLPLKAEGRLDEERLLFRLAVGGATEKLALSFPRIEIGTGRERLPSSYLLASVKALTGKSVDFQEIEQFSEFLRIPLSEITVKNPGRALDETEFDLSIGQQKLEEKRPEAVLYLQEVSRFFGRGLQLESSRWGKPVFTNFEGILSSKEALQILRERHSIFEKSISPTRLETYASCPFRYLLNVIMGMEALKEPEKEATINPFDKGTLVHSILWEYFTDLKKERRGPVHLEPKDLGRLLQTAQKKFVEFEQRGVTGYSMLWEVAKRSILDDLKNFFLEELKESEFIPTYFEVRYGSKAYDIQESEISTEEPVPLELRGKTVHLKGKIDRIDLTKDGKRARIRDYKSGKKMGKENDFMKGTALQLPLYLYAARHFLGSLHRDIQVQRAEYYFLKERKKKRFVKFECSALEEKAGELDRILEIISEGIEEGAFIAVPNDRCSYCDFELICGSWSKFLFNRKEKDPKVKKYLDMRAGEQEPKTDEAEESEE